MLQGIIVKAEGGFFTVGDDSGAEYLCRARGVLKKSGGELIVGDRVLFAPTGSASTGAGEGVIEKQLPRSNRLFRPPVANVDQLVIVMSLKQPECDWQLVSRLQVLAEKEGLAAFLCLNKIDLVDKIELSELSAHLDPYPYPVLYTCAISGEGIDRLKDFLKGRCSVFAGPSGVGKSSLLNAIQPGLSLQVGPISEKIRRGRHTTRRAELLPLDIGGSVVDTPGFMRLDFRELGPAQLAELFPEFGNLRSGCAFRDCLHLSEPDCAVQREIGKTLNPMRYEHYRYFVKELNEREVF